MEFVTSLLLQMLQEEKLVTQTSCFSFNHKLGKKTKYSSMNYTVTFLFALINKQKIKNKSVFKKQHKSKSFFIQAIVLCVILLYQQTLR